jgi:hypothetical protein
VTEEMTPEWGKKHTAEEQEGYVNEFAELVAQANALTARLVVLTEKTAPQGQSAGEDAMAAMGMGPVVGEALDSIGEDGGHNTGTKEADQFADIMAEMAIGDADWEGTAYTILIILAILAILAILTILIILAILTILTIPTILTILTTHHAPHEGEHADNMKDHWVKDELYISFVDAVSSCWFTCDQAKRIIRKLKPAVRIMSTLCFFQRVVDLHNFYVILDLFPPQQRTELQVRI